MMQELADKVWGNPGFQDAAHRIELAWLTKEIGGIDDGHADIADATRLMRSAAILACSETADHRRAAFRVATCAYDLFGTAQVPLDQALRVVLTRLGNFPSIGTRADVASARASLPLMLAAEEIVSADAHEVTINGQAVLLTDFQQQLWLNLIKSRRIALAAPTSAGKSFVLQGYLSALFHNEQPKSVVYIVPTRALIAQVAEDLKAQFQGMQQDLPDIVTVPVDAETTLAGRAIYVMTQERVQLALGAHPYFSASVIIVDEAHSIADGSRGVLLQWVIDDLLIRNPASQILFASPEIRNLDVFGRLFGLNDVVEFSSVEPTVAQNFLVTTVESATKGKLVIHTAGDGSRTLRQAKAASIHAKGILQNLVVEPELDAEGAASGFYLVSIGDLRHGAAGRVPAEVLSDVPLRRMGSGRSRSLAGHAPSGFECEDRQTRTVSRRTSEEDPAGHTVGSGTSRSIDGG